MFPPCPVSENLAGQLLFLLWRETRLECFKAFGIPFSHKVAFGVVIGAGYAIEKAGLQLLYEEIWNYRVIGIGIGITDAFCAGHDKAGLAVEVYVACDGQRFCTHIACLFH